ncbi:hypothetical protein AX769_11540 [Frondihabitans sp. PAMC 28766]|uniref:DUF427 domain-containing protein n=1 Tax=Frondihabitans sp. PAMC 28766 TaxID=1795630 RepID=UPI00078C166A|nr:DUF427 domain-containing protein [Frondihabitans sp. PAMC 28766]AMM20659.1 hypothetical protein AX769_11540 [Frondihabitans sp. PAMC 28766]
MSRSHTPKTPSTARIEPGPGQESVWDYPRPPRVEETGEHVVVTLGGAVVAETSHALRVLETSHPPVYYLPRSSFAAGALHPAPGASLCEFKGQAAYADVSAGGVVAAAAAWFYRTPWAGFEVLADHVALYPGAMDSCTVDGETVTAQEGDFYGGWITSRVVGPFKGAPGTLGW